ncbi:hypothetical protein CCAX7_43330 [Capsulimonas corticalis]|uniref:Uncharacterized protein n=1 Tax=Capsulimonas corticalis TaxID=2219043 RepID=A0A402CXK1_9BACT|nr:hypothetical protein [Capsulimonas corticalis]BDI32282.1 hypothetical protein CCAX7_43330 [Capsulimonas corticalis]
MGYRGRIDDPGVMEGILERIQNLTREDLLKMLARYDNEKPGDVILPGVPPRFPKNDQPIVLQIVPPRASRAKRRTPKRQKAA